MTFVSLLFAATPRPDEAMARAPEHFADLALDRIVAGVTAGRDRFGLAPLWHLPLRDHELIGYRQAVFADLELPAVRSALERFAEALGDVGRRLAPDRPAETRWQQRRWVLDAAAGYCRAIGDLTAALPAAGPRSDALRGLASWLAGHTAGPVFASLCRDVAAVSERLDALRYDVLLRGLKVTVEAFDGEPDLTEQVTATFARFRQAPAQDHRSRLPAPSLDRVAAQVSELVAKLFPDEHAELTRFAAEHAHFVDPTVELLARELQFYLGYRSFLARLDGTGLATTLPGLGERGHLEATATYDLALAASLAPEARPVVTNDVALRGRERILVVTGPNQGGKTTLARTVGQLYYLASLGCPVPGRAVRLAVPDGIHTHFERQEDVARHVGRLEDDLVRIRGILESTTADSVVVLNEIFSSTALADARLLSGEVLRRLGRIGAVCVCVTFIDELSRLDDSTVSMVATVDPDDPAVRTLRLERRPADGRAHALALARKYGLTYDQLVGGRPGPGRQAVP